MPSYEESTQTLVDGLFSQSQPTKLVSIRKIKNLIIGNRTKKSTFMLLGVIPRLVCLLGDDESTTELICEAVITLGSFAHGTSENVQAVLSAKAVPVLVRGICQVEPSVVCACLRTLRTLYLSGHAPPDAIFQDNSVARQLVQLISGSHLVGQCAATILAKACQTKDHQNQLVAHGVIIALATSLQSTAPKLVHASLQCLASVVYENTMSASVVADASCNNHSLVSAIAKILSASPSNEAKLAAAQCLSYLCRAGAISCDSPVITLKALPSLVKLCKKDLPAQSHLKSEATSALAYLTQESVDLQELAANSDRLIPTLVEFLLNRPNESDDLVLEKDFELFDRLRESAFLAIASVSSTREEIRMKVVSDGRVMKCLKEALNGDNVSVRVAAARCLHSLSRSTKLLRTSIVDSEVWRPILDMLSLKDEECLTISTGVASNMLLTFSPSRERLVEGGVIEILYSLISHDNPAIVINAVWALMSAAYEASSEIRQKIRQTLGMDRLIHLLSPSTEEKLLMKVLGLTVNLVHDAEDADMIVEEYGSVLLHSLVSFLRCSSSSDVREQVMCVVMNLAHASEKSRDSIVNCDDLMLHMADILRTNDRVSLLMATCSAVKHLADCCTSGYIHRQNCLEEYGIRVAIQKLEKIDNYTLQDIVKDTLDNFSSCSLSV